MNGLYMQRFNACGNLKSQSRYIVEREISNLVYKESSNIMNVPHKVFIIMQLSSFVINSRCLTSNEKALYPQNKCLCNFA